MTLSLATAQERYATDADVFAHDTLVDPYDTYRSLRDIGRVSYMTRYDTWALTRYDEVRHALGDWQTFSSAQGIAMSTAGNEATKDSASSKDGADHLPMRKLMMQHLGPKAAAAYKEKIQQAAVTLVEELLDRREFDAVLDFAQMMPMRVFMEVLGVEPDIEQRRTILHWATDTYNCAAPDGLYDDTLPSMDKLSSWALENLTPETAREGSVAASTWESVERGDVTDVQAVAILAGYVTAGLDTTAGTLGNTIAQFAANPDQWAIVRDDPKTIPGAILEGIRFDSVGQWFTRVTTRDVEYDDIVIPAGSRTYHSYGAANRDERHYRDPDSFDVLRNPTDHVGFGYGPHMCVGKSLSNIEMIALWTELGRRVDRIEQIGPKKQHINNLIRSLDSLPVRIYPK